jgi:hypothetical protein
MRSFRNLAFLLLVSCVVVVDESVLRSAGTGFCETYSCNCEPLLESDPPDFCSGYGAFQCQATEGFCFDHWVNCYYFCYPYAIYDEQCSGSQGFGICKCASC